MRRLSQGTVALFLGLWAAAGCEPPPVAAPEPIPPLAPEPPVEVPPADAKAVVEGGNAFALDLYKTLAAKPGNVVCSPYSVSAALAMTYAGARGETAAEMAKVLGFTTLGERVHPSQADLAHRLKGDPAKGQPEFHVANALWGQRGVPFMPEFLALTRTHYGAGLREVDYIGDTEGARRTINGWVGEQTKGKIPELILAGMLTESTRLTLTNAIYFKGSWLHEFPIKDTVDDKFRVTATETVPTRMMHARIQGWCYEGDGVKAVWLPYQGGGKSMLIVVPDEIEGLGAVEGMLTAEQLKRWRDGRESTDVKLQLPKFKATFKSLLGETLRGMGMPLAFDGVRADFSGIVQSSGWFIKDVIHEAVVEVDEQGTVAAAATAVVMNAPISMPRRRRIITVRADRPFLYLIVDDATQAIMFVGRVAKP